MRATHTFLSDAEIGMISRCVPEFIRAVPHLIVAADAVGQAVAFMGISGRKIEMLFVDPALRGQLHQNALATAARYSAEHFAQQVLDAYQQAIALKQYESEHKSILSWV